MRVAALDIGTNTALLLVADVANDELHIIRDEHAIARLGEGVDRSRRISEKAMDRLRSILSKYRVIIDSSDVDIVSAIGTSALRDAGNRDEVITTMSNEFGISISVIDGIEESRLTYLGAVSDRVNDNTSTAVIDIGGGSTEIAFGNGRSYHYGVSIDIGAVRLTEQDSDTDLQRLFAEKLTAIPKLERIIAVAGTPTTLAAIDLNLDTFDRNRVDGHVITSVKLDSILSILMSQSAEELQKRFPVIPKGRADILPAGASILLEALKFLSADTVSVSIRGLRYGIALDSVK